MNLFWRCFIVWFLSFPSLLFPSYAEEAESSHITFLSDYKQKKCDFFYKNNKQRKIIMSSINKTQNKKNLYRCLSSLPEDKFRSCTLTGIDFTEGSGVCHVQPEKQRFNIEVSAKKGRIACSFSCS
ncbi:hypothetical protein [Photobacterium swingsii]|uniref:hypothetical protein n=1 Tax=Photobacterium swingsii TaxID=680026 RepID=UPI00406955D0